jgi:hypothetical protein
MCYTPSVEIGKRPHSSHPDKIVGGIENEIGRDSEEKEVRDSLTKLRSSAYHIGRIYT